MQYPIPSYGILQLGQTVCMDCPFFVLGRFYAFIDTFYPMGAGIQEGYAHPLEAPIEWQNVIHNTADKRDGFSSFDTVIVNGRFEGRVS